MDQDIKIISHSDRIDHLLEPYRETIGEDFEGYRNHILRVLTYAMHLLEQDESARPLVETALVYHDIGLWTENELAYLEPSEALARKDAEAQEWGLDVDLIIAIIHWHHKITAYKGAGAEIVNAVRKADWVDATQGGLKKDFTKAQIEKVSTAIPAEGFYDALNRKAVDIGGSAFSGNLKVLRHVFKW